MDPAAHVGLATLALLCYRLLFCSDRELSLTALLFCAACAWCAGQLAAAAAGAPGVPGASTFPGASTVASAARTLCDSVLWSAHTREACWNYMRYFVADEAPP